MNPLHTLRMRLRALRRRDELDRELDEELRFHIEMQTEQNVARGMSPAEARRRALVDFGGMEGHREASRDTRGVRWLEETAGDVRYALRGLRRAPGFALAAALTIGLGIGANTAIFGVVDALFLRPPAGVRAPDEVLRLYIARDAGMIQNPAGGAGSYLDFRAIRGRVPGLAATAAFFEPGEVDLDRGEQAQRIRATVVSRSFFPLLGVRAERGRFFLAEEDSVPGSNPVAVISYDFWRRHFGGEPDAVGKTLLLNGQLLTVVGVAQRGFTGLSADPVDAWVTMAMASPLGLVTSTSDWRLQPMMIQVHVIGRLAPGSTPEAVASASSTALRQAAEAAPGLDPTPRVIPGTLIPARGPNRPRAADLALSLVAVTAIVLVIACANVANLLLSRGTTRRRETAIRLSIGAGRGRLFRQHLTESLVLSVIGGALGVLLALLGSGIVRQFPLPPAAAELNPRTLLFALALTVGTGLVFGLVPALQAGRSDPVRGLKEVAGGASPAGRRLRSALVGVQVALAVVLLIGAGLFIRSLGAIDEIRPGADIERLLLVSVDLQKAGYASADREALYASASERVRRIPGVEAAVMAHFPPLPHAAFSTELGVPGGAPIRVPDGPYINYVAPRYFATTGARLLLGRDFTAADRTGEPTALVNESFARVLAHGGSPLGICIAVGEQNRTKECTRVIGVVQNQRRGYLDEHVAPFLFLDRERDPDRFSYGGPTLIIRTRGDAASKAAEVRAAVQSLDPRLPFVSVQPLTDVIRADLLPYRLGASLFTLFGVLALTLTAVGLYGSLGYFIAERRPEIGIRRALGAGERDVVRLVLRAGMLPVLAGLTLGQAAAYYGSRLLEKLLFGIGARDTPSFLAAALFLACVAIVASYLPARRAARVDPMVALRAE